MLLLFIFLRCEEILVIGHSEYGMAHANSEKVKSKMIEMGIKEEGIEFNDDLANGLEIYLVKNKIF